MTPFAKRLSEVREQRGLSRRGLSLQAGLTDSVVGQIERGAISDPSSATLAKLADVLGVTTDWLLKGRGHANHHPRIAENGAEGTGPVKLRGVS